MSLTIRNKYLILALAIALAGTLTLGWHWGKGKADRASTDMINTLNGLIKEYVIDIDGLKKQVSEKDQLILTQNQAIDAHLIEKSELKKLHFKTVNEVTKLKGLVRILRDSIAATGTYFIVEPCDSVEVPFPAIKLPFSFGDTTQYYTFGGGFNEKGKMNIDLTIPMDDISIWTGYKKGNKKPVATITTSNPYITISDIQSIKIEPKKPFYNKTWFRLTGLAVSFGAGVYVGSR